MKTRECRACFENACAHGRFARACRAYDAQIAWTRRVMRLLKADGQIPVPPPPDDSKPHTDWVIGGRAERETDCGQANLWARDMYALLKADGKPYKGFRAAIERATA